MTVAIGHVDRTSRTEPAVPRWGNVVAHVIPLLTLPSGLWRVGVALGFSMGVLEDDGRPAHVERWAAPMVACYAPLNLWGPLLLVLTWAYYRRRTTRDA